MLAVNDGQYLDLLASDASSFLRCRGKLLWSLKVRARLRDDNDDDEEQDVIGELVFEEDKRDRWDCETILCAFLISIIRWDCYNLSYSQRHTVI